MSPWETTSTLSPFVFVKPMWILWKKFLSSGLSCSGLKIWLFIYCPVVIMSTLNFGVKWKQRIKEAFGSPTKLYTIRSVSIIRKYMRAMSYANSGVSGFLPSTFPESFARKTSKMCPMSVCPKCNLNFAWSSTHFYSDTTFNFCCVCVALDWRCTCLSQNP